MVEMSSKNFQKKQGFYQSSNCPLFVMNSWNSRSLFLLFILSIVILSSSSLFVIVDGFPRNLPPSINPPRQSLYTYVDPVNILYTSNITKFISNEHQNGKKIQLIQFYNSYCGHCQNLSPLYKEFLKSTKKWTWLVDFSVIDCSYITNKESNQEACSQYQIGMYPTLRTFWFKPSPSDIGQDFQLNGNDLRSAKDLRNSFIKWLSNNWQQGKMPKHFPNFPPLIADTKEELLDKLNLAEDSRTVLIIVEKINSFFGRELMMNFSRHFDEIKMFRIEESSIKVLDQISMDVLDKFKMPFLFSISNQDREFKIIPKPMMSSEDDSEYFTKLIQKDFLKKQLFDEKEEINGQDETNKNLENSRAEYSTRIYMSDLHNAIRFALFSEVPLKKYLDLDQVNALIRFLNVLYESFPFQNEKTKQFIKHLHDWLVRYMNRNRSRTKRDNIINTSDMLATMNMYEEYYHFPEHKPWRACSVVTSNRHRSYPCSLWTMFHVLTVAEYRRSLQTKQWVSLHPTLYAMREYIKHFFGCTECSQHFQVMSATLENELTYPNSSVLWLWRSHNKVNARLKGSLSEDPRLPKRQFPTYKECSYCYHKQPPLTSDEMEQMLFKNYTNYLSFYDQEKVLQFLVNYYAVERIVQDESEFEDNPGKQTEFDHPIIIDDTVTNHATKPRSKILILVSSPFTQTDISLIFVFYVVSILLLISIFSYVRLRRNIFHKVFNLKQRVY